MKVKDIIVTALMFVGRDDISKKLANDEDDVELTAEESEVVETLLYCFNSVEDELARCYIPLETVENLSSENGVYSFADFSLRPVKIISVKSDGKPVKYSITALSLITDCAEITVEYAYAPLKKGLSDDSEFSSVLASDKLVAAGTASEFCLIDGEAQLAQTWESVYRGEIETLQRTRLSGLHLPPRRWV
ncbi:MAG: hypothetical protein K2K38_04465 [Clostridia bacterium]|nr:hypothetical protein [Clostridia bacterium]